MAQAQPSESLILRQVSYRYKKHTALYLLDLTVEPGVFGLLGPNGAGKTTLIQLFSTTLTPDAGTMQIFGQSPAHSKSRDIIRRQLGYLPQHFGYYPEFTVAEFVEYFALLKGVAHGHVAAAVARALEAVGLSDAQRQKLRTLSGGMIRRAGIAQAIVNDPKLLLLDEPTVGLDPQQRIRFRELLRQLGQHSIVFVSTHLVEDVVAACNQVAVLQQGRLVYQGTPHDLIAQGIDSVPGDSAIERGYSAVLQSTGDQQW